MNLIAKMGQQSCSHDAEQTYLMKKMINVVHTAAMNRCGVTPKPCSKPISQRKKAKKT